MPMEKQGTVENQLAHTIDQTEYDSRYDRIAKKLLANKQILAQIMKGCVNEYSDCTVDDIVEKYIEGTPEVGSVGVHEQYDTLFLGYLKDRKEDILSLYDMFTSAGLTPRFVIVTDMFLTEYIILAIHLNSQGALPDMVLNKVKENANLMV